MKKALGYFNCVSLDGHQYNKLDYSVSCESERYQNFRPLAVFTLCFAIFIPIALAMCLTYNGYFAPDNLRVLKDNDEPMKNNDRRNSTREPHRGFLFQVAGLTYAHFETGLNPADPTFPAFQPVSTCWESIR